MATRCEHEKALEVLTEKVCQVIRAIDKTMQRYDDDNVETSRVKRGARLMEIVEFLEMGNDSAMHVTLGWGWRQIANRKKGKQPGRPGAVRATGAGRESTARTRPGST